MSFMYYHNIIIPFAHITLVIAKHHCVKLDVIKSIILYFRNNLKSDKYTNITISN